MSVAVRSESQGDSIGTLCLVAAEQLRELAEGQGEDPKPVNGTHLHPDCPHCSRD